MRLILPFHQALPVHEELFHEGLYVTHAGWEHILPHQPYPNRNHPAFYYFEWSDGRILPAFCLAWVLEGRGEFQTKAVERHVGPGDVFLMLPGEWHRHRPDPAVGWDLAWIEFNGTLPYRSWRQGAFGKTPNFPSIESPALFASAFERILTRIQREPSANSAQLSWAAIGLLSHLMVDTLPPRQGTGTTLIDRAIEHIWNYSHGILDVPEIARHLGVGRRTLERHFRTAVGHGVLEEIQRCRFPGRPPAGRNRPAGESDRPPRRLRQPRATASRLPEIRRHQPGGLPAAGHRREYPAPVTLVVRRPTRPVGLTRRGACARPSSP